MLAGKKRGSRQLYAVAELVIGGLLLALFIYRGTMVGSDAAQQRLYLAQDIAFTIDALHSVSGNVEYRYPQAVTPYLIEASESKVSVSSAGRPETFMGASFIEKTSHPVSARLSTPPLLWFSKVGSDITISKEQKASGRLACADTPSGADFATMRIVIDYDDAGDTELVAKRTAKATASLCTNCRVIGEESLAEKTTSAHSADLVVRIVSSPDAGVRAQYPTDAKKSAKLACLVANSLAPLAGEPRMFGAEIAALSSLDPRRVLQQDVPSVQVEIGRQEGSVPESRIVELARAVYDGMYAYTQGPRETSAAGQDIPSTCANPRDDTYGGAHIAITPEVIAAAERTGTAHHIPAGALVAIGIKETGLSPNLLGKPCPPENARAQFRPGQVTQRVFVSGEEAILPDSCSHPTPDGDDQLLARDEAAAAGRSCTQAASCAWVPVMSRVACDAAQGPFPAYQCMASYASTDEAMDDWAAGFERIASGDDATRRCGEKTEAAKTDARRFAEYAACVLHQGGEGWSAEIVSIIDRYCLSSEESV